MAETVNLKALAQAALRRDAARDDRETAGVSRVAAASEAVRRALLPSGVVHEHRCPMCKPARTAARTKVFRCTARSCAGRRLLQCVCCKLDRIERLHRAAVRADW